MGVVCGTGLVGVVYMTSAHYSVVMPVLNIHSRISCAIRDRGYFGYLSWDGKNPTEAYMDDVPRHAQFSPGEWVETSGYSAIFPPDIPLGIAGEAKVINGATNEISVRLFQDHSALKYVTIIENTRLSVNTSLTALVCSVFGHAFLGKRMDALGRKCPAMGLETLGFR